MDFTQANYSKIFDKHLPKCVSLSRYLDITHLRWVILVFTRGNHIKFNYFFSSRAFSSFLAVEWSWLRRGLALFPPLVMSSSLWIIFYPSSMTGRWQVEHAVHSNRMHSRVEWFLKNYFSFLWQIQFCPKEFKVPVIKKWKFCRVWDVRA